MLLCLLLLFCSFLITDGRHFDGGIITWTPVNPYQNASSVDITVTQSYSWAYPIITCANNVPITTSGRSTQNWNLICVVDCSTDGGYSTKPIDMLTDCTSVSASLGMMSSARSHNLSLTAGAHFYLANVGSAWVALNDPPQNGLEWSIVTLIDLRMRPDGFINTPPVASVVSPQYAFVNKTIAINIPVSDVNEGDDVRCRWSIYTPGNRRRKRSYEEKHTDYKNDAYIYKGLNEFNEIGHIRKKRACSCANGNACSSGTCPTATSCSGQKCTLTCCDDALDTTSTTSTSTTSTTSISTTSTKTITTTSTTTTKTTTTTSTITIKTTTTTTDSTTPIGTTTVDTPGILKSTSSYVHIQAIDECGGICYPGSVPNGTTLSNCTISFTGLKAGTWYGVAVQVEDFINNTSTTPMSSVPVQFLIYVLPTPKCPNAPVILPLTGCLEVKVGAAISFNLYAMNLCNNTIATLTDIVVSSQIIGMTAGNLTNSPTNSSLSYVTFTWIPQMNQVGPQQFCTIAFTSEKVQSAQYCVTFTVKNSSDVCITTTTTSTSTTSKTTTTTSTTTGVIATTNTQTTTTTTISTSTTTSVTTMTFTSTTSVTTLVTPATATTKTSERPANWSLILGLSLLPLLLALCGACCCLGWFLWGPAARRRRQKDEEEDDDDSGQQTFLPQNVTGLTRKTRIISRIYPPGTPSKDNLINTNGNISANELPSVTVLQMNKLPNMNETNKRNPDAIRQKVVSTTSILPSKSVQVYPIETSRNQITKHYRRNAASMDNVSISHLDKPSFEMQPITINIRRRSMLRMSKRAQSIE